KMVVAPVAWSARGRMLPTASMQSYVPATGKPHSLTTLKQRFPDFHRRCSEQLPTLHGIEEVFVGFRIFEFVDEEFDGGKIFHTVQQLAQNPHARQLLFAGNQFFAASAGAADIDRREYTLLRDLAIEV